MSNLNGNELGKSRTQPENTDLLTLLLIVFGLCGIIIGFLAHLFGYSGPIRNLSLGLLVGIVIAFVTDWLVTRAVRRQ